MQHGQPIVLTFTILLMAVAGCGERPSQPSPAAGAHGAEPNRGSAGEVATASNSKKFANIIEFPRRTLIFQPTRDDLTVGRVIFNLYCSKPDGVRVNGVRPDPTWREVHLAPEGDLVVDKRGIPRDELGGAWMFIYLTPQEKNQFELGPLKIEYADGDLGGCLCMSIKLWFNEVTNYDDGTYYQKLADRFALVSYRTTEAEPHNAVNWQFKTNRVATAEEFKEIVAGPFIVRLNDRPLAPSPHP